MAFSPADGKLGSLAHVAQFAESVKKDHLSAIVAVLPARLPRMMYAVCGLLARLATCTNPRITRVA